MPRLSLAASEYAAAESERTAAQEELAAALQAVAEARKRLARAKKASATSAGKMRFESLKVRRSVRKRDPHPRGVRRCWRDSESRIWAD